MKLTHILPVLLHRIRYGILTLCCFISVLNLQSQTEDHSCRTELSAEQIAWMQRHAEAARNYQIPNSRAPREIAMKVHVIGTSAGQHGQNLEKIDQNIAYINERFANANIKLVRMGDALFRTVPVAKASTDSSSSTSIDPGLIATVRRIAASFFRAKPDFA